MTDTTRPLLDRLTALAGERGRALVGVCGPPGAGKSTIAAALASSAVIVPMDGFHLACEQIRGTERERRRGAPDTFDAAGYVAALERIRAASEPVYLPRFDRDIADPIAGAILVKPSDRIVVTEGNYLLLDTHPWSRVRELLDEIWYVELVDEAQRRIQLIERHMRYGANEADATAHADGSDQLNARLIATTRPRADAIVTVGADGELELAPVNDAA